MSQIPTVRLVIFDWAGTTVDHGCFAPVAAFIESFARCGVEISTAQAREPMGIHKKDHVRAIAQMPEVAQRWKSVHGRDWLESDTDDVYQNHFVPLQLEAAVKHSHPVPGLIECVAALTDLGIRIGTSTGYFREVAEKVYAHAESFGYVPDFNVCADDVPQGRPAPWMIYRNMEAIGVYPTRLVVKVGDTVPDIAEGRNAGVWTIGVCESGSLVGCTVDELQQLASAHRRQRVEQATAALQKAGAHLVIASVAQLPSALVEINRRVESNESPF